MQTIAHPIPGRITPHDTQRVQQSIDHASTYSDKVATALKCVIETIHGLPRLHSGLASQEIEIYIGKSERSADAVLKRWKQHHDTKKKHMYGAILFKCSLSDAKKLEKLAIRVVKKLKEHHRLCVGQANIASGSQGKDPKSSNALIYMTWCPLNGKSAYAKPTTQVIREVASQVAPSVKEFVKEAQILGGLTAIKRPTNYRKLRMDYYR